MLPLIACYLIVPAIILYLVLKCLIPSNEYKLFNKIPGPLGWPLIKNLHEVIFTRDQLGMVMLNFIRKYSNDIKYQGIFKMDFIADRLVFLNTPDSVQALLTSANYNKGRNYEKWTEFTGNGLMTSNGQKWHHDRKSLTAGFTKRSLDNYFTTLKSNAISFAQQLHDQEIVHDLRKLTFKFSLESILKSALEVDDCIESPPVRDYSQNLETTLTIAIERVLHILLRFDLIYKLSSKSTEMFKAASYMKQFAMSVFREKRDAMVDEFKRYGQIIVLTRPSRTILQCLMKLHHTDPVVFNEIAVIDHLNNFIAGGNDTTGICLCMALYHLAMNIDQQQLLLKELETLEDNEDYTMKDVARLKYLDAVLKETLRLSTVIPIIGRSLEKDLKIGDYVVPKKSEVIVCIEVIHLNEQLYQDATKFLPERWLAGNEHMKSDHPFAYLPFSGGLRNCIGKKFVLLELKLALIHIVKNFQIELLTRVKLKMEFALTMKPVTPVAVRFIPRHIA